LQFSAKLIQHIAPQPEPMAPQLEPNEEDISVAATSHKKPVSRDIVLGEPNIQKLLQFSAKLIQNITPPQSSVARDLVLGEPNIQKLLQFSAKLIQHIKPLSEETVAREPNLQKLLQFSAKLIQHIIEKQKPTKQITQQPSVAREIVLVEPNIQKLLQFSAKLIQHIIEKQSVAQIPAAPKVPVLSSAKVVPLEGVVVFDVNKLLLFSNRLLKQIIKPATAAKPAGESSGWFGLFGRNQPPTAKDVKQDEIRKPEYTINKDQLEEAPQTTSQEEAQITVLDNKPKIDLSSTEGMHVGIFDTNYDIQGKEEYEIKNENGREVLYRKSVGNMAVGDVATATPISDEFITDQSISV
jgi:hypothetical protein